MNERTNENYSERTFRAVSIFYLHLYSITLIDIVSKTIKYYSYHFIYKSTNYYSKKLKLNFK